MPPAVCTLCCAVHAVPCRRLACGFAAAASASTQPPRPAPPACPRRCQLIKGTPVLKGGSGYTEHVWVTKDEVGEYIQQPELLQLLEKLL